jgi:hypothetical protein
MNDVRESWSIPWHALQRRLAEPAPAAAARPRIRAGAPPAAASWLARARRGTLSQRAVAHLVSSRAAG